MKPELSLVIAAYNCEEEIERTLHRVHASFSRLSSEYEVIVADDGSVDKTGTILQSLGSLYPEMRILVNGMNRGKGYSIRRGMLEVSGRFVFYTDADLSYPIEAIESFLKPLRAGTHEVAVGSRVHANSVFHLHPRYFRYIYRRHLMSRLFNWLVRMSLGIRAMDTQSGFKGFTAEAAQAIFPRVEITGFAFDVEVLLIAQRLGYRLVELPVTYAYHGEVSTVKVFENACQALVDLARIYCWDRWGKYRVNRQGFSHRA